MIFFCNWLFCVYCETNSHLLKNTVFCLHSNCKFLWKRACPELLSVRVAQHSYMCSSEEEKHSHCTKLLSHIDFVDTNSVMRRIPEMRNCSGFLNGLGRVERSASSTFHLPGWRYVQGLCQNKTVWVSVRICSMFSFHGHCGTLLPLQFRVQFCKALWDCVNKGWSWLITMFWGFNCNKTILWFERFDIHKNRNKDRFWYSQPESLYSFHHWNIVENVVPSPLGQTHWVTQKSAQWWTSTISMQWGDNKLSHFSTVNCFLFFFCKGSQTLFVIFFFCSFSGVCFVCMCHCVHEVSALEYYSARACVHTLTYVNAACRWPSRLKKSPTYLFGKSSEYKHTQFVQHFGFLLSVFQLLSQANWSSLHFHVCLFWTYICEVGLGKKSACTL